MLTQNQIISKKQKGGWNNVYAPLAFHNPGSSSVPDRTGSDLPVLHLLLTSANLSHAEPHLMTLHWLPLIELAEVGMYMFDCLLIKKCSYVYGEIIR